MDIVVRLAKDFEWRPPRDGCARSLAVAAVRAAELIREAARIAGVTV